MFEIFIAFKFVSMKRVEQKGIKVCYISKHFSLIMFL